MNTKQLIKSVHQQLDEVNFIDDPTVSREINRTLMNDNDFQALSLSEKHVIFNNIFNAIRRLNVLQSLLDNDEITEIMVNGPNHIFIEIDGVIQKTNLSFDDLDSLNNVIQKIVSAVNRSINTANPIVDARLEDGSRISVVLPPVALNGPILTIRKFRKSRYYMSDLIANESITESAANYLIDCINQRKNIFIAGGTGSGKTTFLNVLSNYINPQHRVISIEDSAELQLDALDNWVRLETRNQNSQGVGEITIRQLIKTALRMRPDRIVVGEVRGEEALDMLQAMNTGHNGSLSTGHANSIIDMLTRLETMIFSAKSLPIESIRQQIGSAIDVFVYIARMKDGTRKITSIQKLMSFRENRYQMEVIYNYCHDKNRLLNVN